MFPYPSISMAAALALQWWAGPPTIDVGPPMLVEHSRASVNVSGEDVVGLSGNNLHRPLGRTELDVSGFRSSDQFICVSIDQASGLYAAEFVAPRPQGAHRVRFRIRSSQLRTSSPSVGEFAVKVHGSANASCESPSPLLPVSWTGQSNEITSVMINSQRASYVALSVPGQRERPCMALRSAVGASVVGRTFDTVCQVQLPPCGSVRDIVIQRQRAGSALPPVRVSISGRC